MTDATPNKRGSRPPNPRWESIPIGTRLTLSEAARILGIERESLRKNYSGERAPRRLPDGVTIVRDNRTVLLVRSR